MKRYILDTHVVLWLEEPHKLSNEVLEILTSNAPKSISFASVWEVAIKLNQGKLELEGGVDGFYKIAEHNNLTIIGFRKPYFQVIECMGLIHKDPFDRMIIATAKTQELTIITADEKIQKYDVDWVWGG